eukprot:3453831-Alexandrium_andersonii.AAC.1
MSLIERRGVVKTAGGKSELPQLRKDIARSAKKDKAQWIADAASTSLWDPVRTLTKKRAAPPLSLRGPADSVATEKRPPPEVYA